MTNAVAGEHTSPWEDVLKELEDKKRSESEAVNQ
jgi:hypothetical protein